MSSLRDSSNIADDHEDRSKRTPRDVHLIHLILTSLGVPAYGNQTPLQLLTFAHRMLFFLPTTIAFELSFAKYYLIAI